MVTISIMTALKCTSVYEQLQHFFLAIILLLFYIYMLVIYVEKKLCGLLKLKNSKHCSKQMLG